jgi:Ig-like domain-containing protein/immunoglobulin I-set domain protein
VTETSGASVIVPAGALTTDTTIRIAMDSTGAPPIPAGLHSAGNVYAITPHGGEFAEPIEVRLPVPTTPLQPNQALKIAKAEPGGPWVVLDDTELVDGKLSTTVSSFSWFMTIIVSYPLPVLQALPFAVTTTLDCGVEDCAAALGDVTATYTVAGNNGQLPDGCDGVVIDDRASVYAGSGPATGIPMARTGGSVTRQLSAADQLAYRFAVAISCNGYLSRVDNSYLQVSWKFMPSYPRVIVVRVPEQIDVVEGLQANVSVVMSGGAVTFNSPIQAQPLETDRATVEWQRSNDSGASWQLVGRSYQNEADPTPISLSIPWRFWGVRHGFIATASDQGSLIRVRGCYTPPAPTEAAPCVTGQATRINVLQQSVLPAIVTPPRSVLVRTGQTASLSATTSGTPAPTLQWQTRPANSNAAWENVTSGVGAVTANYTTAATTLADNGVQYRILATNAVGSIATSAVTVSVSDLDVAPTISTQPANLSVASGSDAVFAVDAHGTEALGYQWRRNGVALAGANSPVLRLTGVTTINAGSYTVTVSNSAGDADSNAAALNVYPGTPAAVAPTIVTQPAAVNVNAGNTATFAVGVDGSGPFTFQWRRDGVNVSGATSAVLTFNSVALPNAGTYSVVVSNSAGAIVSNNTTLDVGPAAGAVAPSITSQPSTVIVPAGGSAVLAVAATGSGPLSYQWTRDGVLIAGATQPVLTFPTVSESNAADYRVTVSNSLGDVVSQTATLILLGAPVIYTSPSNVSAFENSTTTFRVDSAGSGRHFQWLRNGSPIGSSDSDAYTTPSLTVADSGAVYSVIVYNSAGLVVSAPAVLTVRVPVPPTVSQQPADASIQAGATASLCMAFGGMPPFAVQMNRWMNNEWTPTGPAQSFTDNATHCMATPALQSGDNGAQFIFFASNDEGGYFEAMTRTVTVTVTAPPAITATTLVSRATSGATANNRSGAPSISADGNIVAFISDGTNLVPGFVGSPFTQGNAFVRNMTTGVTTQINVTPAGTQSASNYGVIGLKLAAGGRHAIFSSLAPDMVADDTNGSQDVFVRDLQTGVTTRVSLQANGAELPFYGNGQSDMQVNISADGRYVSFVTSQDLIGDDPSGAYALYFRSLQTGFLRRVFSSTTSLVAYSALSDNGEHLAYLYATFVPGATYNTVVHYDTEANSRDEVFSIDSTNNASFVAQGIGISGNGQYVTFAVRSPSMFNGSNFTQVVAIDRDRPSVITVASGGAFGFGNGHSIWPKVSDDGHVLFETNAANLTNDFTNSQIQALVVRDLQSLALNVASRRPNGSSIAIVSGYAYHAISSDGTAVAFAADEFDMSGGTREYQVYVAPRP